MACIKLSRKHTVSSDFLHLKDAAHRSYCWASALDSYIGFISPGCETDHAGSTKLLDLFLTARAYTYIAQLDSLEIRSLSVQVPSFLIYGSSNHQRICAACIHPWHIMANESASSH
ncbi:unnamed protein product [Albugo candida]|uniref:Uncharacterized protein n=1 Tax=Albugo candida TaxID=65357 RepID=A0A024G1D1_9STRA|nr:unnamed protein product [Albugo candida]|eukprot:CCI40351.1 unnamed protein product [Albugo candida]